ncbi:MAG: hypothetical protein ACKVS5_08455 [Parvularculaceae bacterium]
MTERLKQIWSGFEKATTRRLTGRGIENIAVPRRTDLHGSDAMPAADIPAPADAAFAALKHRLTASEQRAARKDERRAKAEGRSFTNAPDLLDTSNAAPEAVRDLVMGLRATEARVSRRDADYAAYLSSNPKGAPKLTPRKKLFGIL